MMRVFCYVITSAIVVDRNQDHKELKDLLMEIIDLLPFCLVIHFCCSFAVANVDGNTLVLPGLFGFPLVIRQIYV